ncbi:MAG: DNA-binding transcriptional regulator PaaX [Planctomycetota bacterium]|jgi:DNA-binding transcriptional regulator PaaX
MQRNNLQKLILQLIAQDGDLARPELTPRTIEILRALTPHRIDERKVKPKYIINRTIKRLEERGMIHYVITETRIMVNLTPEGVERLQQLRGYDEYLDITTKWDGQWRMVILNFSEEERSARDTIRKILKDVGFTSLKGSIWVTQYKCNRLIQVLRDEFDVDHELIFVTASDIEPDIRSLASQQ